MSDTTPTTGPAVARAAFIAAEPSATFASVLAEDPGVVAELKANYPDRFEALEAAHMGWIAAGRPASGIRTAPVQTAPAPRPAPAQPRVQTPDPATASLHDLRDPRVFAAFAAEHPDRLSELVAASRGSARTPNGR